MLAYIYFRQVGSPYLAERIELHGQILGGTAESPYRYRVLVPFIAEGLARALSAVLPGGQGVPSRVRALRSRCDLLSCSECCTGYLRAWFSNEQALVGVLFAAATMPMALRDHYFQPWSVLEAGLFAAGLLCVRDRRYRLLALVVALASLNRETALFIPLAFLVALAGTKGEKSANSPAAGRAALLFVGYAAIWAAAFFGMRALLGDAPRVVTVEELLARNTISPAIFRTVVHLALVFGAFWIFAVAGFRRAPEFVKRTTLLAPPYLAAVALWGVWYEVRLLMPLYAIVVPLGLSFLYRGRDESPRPDC